MRGRKCENAYHTRDGMRSPRLEFSRLVTLVSKTCKCSIFRIRLSDLKRGY